jgi:hypothetical protein
MVNVLSVRPPLLDLSRAGPMCILLRHLMWRRLRHYFVSDTPIFFEVTHAFRIPTKANL